MAAITICSEFGALNIGVHISFQFNIFVFLEKYPEAELIYHGSSICNIFRKLHGAFCNGHTQKRCPFHRKRLECKNRSQEIPGVTGKFGLGVRNEAGQRLTEFCQENTLVIANTLSQQHKRRLYTWASPDGQYQNQIDYVLCSRRWRRSIQSVKTRPGANCGLDHQLIIAKFRLKLKKAGKTTRPFRYDLNQIP